MTVPDPLSTPTERQAALTVGTVDSVAPDEILARLELDAPQTTALNTGSPTAFPRLNGFVVIPNETGALVGIVTWLGVEASSYPKRPGLKDFGLVDLPFPLRKMRMVPVGTLERTTDHQRSTFRLRRGVVTYPSVGDPVALPSADQLEALTRGRPEDRRVHIGRMLLGNEADVRVDPDKLFGRHLAVLGNTGSGKSCSVAGLIRWSLEGATQDREAADTTDSPNSRFIVLDPNGEYRTALEDLPGFRLFQVPPVETENAAAFRVPAWLFNSQEWASITVASARTQRPVLTQALRELRADLDDNIPPDEAFAADIHKYRAAVASARHMGPEHWAHDYGGRMSTGGLLKSLRAEIESQLDDDKPWAPEAHDLVDDLNGLEKDLLNGRNWDSFTATQLRDVHRKLDALVLKLPSSHVNRVGNEDAPVRFDAGLLADRVDLVVSSGVFEDARKYISGLRMRIRSVLGDERSQPILLPDAEPSLEQWLTDFLGDGKGSSTAVIDLSLVPSDVVEVVVAVLSRMLFEALQRHRRLHKESLPTTLVLEEAHTFVQAHPEHGDEYTTPGEMCVRSFERIAREGRKFGLGLVLSSQRPSELSPTILAQCNTFLLHRLVNDRDQALVGKLVPDNLSGLLSDLPSLPSRHALLLGWAAPLPTMLEVKELAKNHRPQSADPDFWAVWTGKRSAKVDWAKISKKWTGTA